MARVDGFPLFVANVFPGDRAVVRLIEVKKGFGRADLVRLVEAGPWRRAQPCPAADDCGGCDWTALRLDKQLEAKERILLESLRRIGKFDPATLPPITVHPSALNYRNRSRLHRDGDAIGFYALRSNRVVQLPKECEVVGVRTAQTLGGGQAIPPVPGQAGMPVLHESSAGGDDGAPTIWEIDDELIADDRDFTIAVDRYTYRLSTRTFFQVNRHLLGTMLGLVRWHAARMSTRHHAVDLYAGVGFFTVPIAEHFHRVTAIEGSSISASYARINVPSNVRIVEAAVEDVEIPKADFIFLDPPRAGARKGVIDAVAAKAKEMVCYLSCDPVTLARDANRLTASGWRLSTLDLVDLFPNTHHVETLSTFERAR